MTAPTWNCGVCGAVNDALRSICYRMCRPPLREPVNVDDFKKRDALIRRIQKSRANAVLEKHTIEYYNRLHPNETPIDSSWCDEVIAWCDGKGPLPTMPTEAEK